MTSQSPARKSKHRDRGDYGFARARDLAFDAVQSLWRKRKSEGMKQVDIAKALDRSPAWVNRSLQGPGNWTLRTLGELVEALNGEIEISVYALEDPLPVRANYHAYAGYEPPYAVVLSVPQASPTPSVGKTATSSPLPAQIISSNLMNPNVPPAAIIKP